MFPGARGLAYDRQGTAMVVMWKPDSICTVTPDGIVTTVAGRVYDGRVYEGYELSAPEGLDLLHDGTMIVTNWGRHMVVKVSQDGRITKFAGDSTGKPFMHPSGVATRCDGVVIVAASTQTGLSTSPETGHKHWITASSIHTITPSGAVNALAGGLNDGFADGVGGNACFRFGHCAGVAVDRDGAVIVADRGNHRIRKISPSGVVTTVAGNGVAGLLDGSSADAQFSWPTDVAVDGEGGIVVADYGNHRIRRISPDGMVSTVAGSGTVPSRGFANGGFADGPAAVARFNGPSFIAIDQHGNILVSDLGNHSIRKISKFLDSYSPMALFETLIVLRKLFRAGRAGLKVHVSNATLLNDGSISIETQLRSEFQRMCQGLCRCPVSIIRKIARML